VRHHFAIARAGRNLAGRTHDAGHAETTLERRTFLAAEWNGAGVRPRILPRAIVGGDDDDGVGSLGPDGVHDLADIGIQFQHGIRVIAEV
jgi:hypothetical protein